jgi:hypothetical protein
MFHVYNQAFPFVCFESNSGQGYKISSTVTAFSEGYMARGFRHPVSFVALFNTLRQFLGFTPFQFGSTHQHPAH